MNANGSAVQERRVHAVDDRRAWLVLAAATLMSFLTFGSALASGTYFVYLEENFRASKTQMGLLYALIGGMAQLLG